MLKFLFTYSTATFDIISRKKSPGLILVYIYVEYVDTFVDLKLCVAELQISANPVMPPELEFIVSWVSCVMLFMMSY